MGGWVGVGVDVVWVRNLNIRSIVGWRGRINTLAASPAKPHPKRGS